MALTITLNGSASPFLTAAIGTPITLAVTSSEGSISDYHWVLTAPEGSAAVLSDPLGVSPTFTPDLEGSYQIECGVYLGDGAAENETATATVLTARARMRVPGYGETMEASPTHGWAGSQSLWKDLVALDRLSARGAAQTCLNAEGAPITVGQCVKIVGYATLGGVTVPTVDLADDTDPATAIFGIVSSAAPGALAGTSVANGAACLVTFVGAVYSVDTAGVMVPGAAVYRTATPGRLGMAASGTPIGHWLWWSDAWISGIAGSAFEPMVDRVKLIYLGKHGGDANDGETPAKAVLTLEQAVTLAAAKSPTATSPAIIIGMDGETYTPTTKTIVNPLGDTVDDTGPLLELPANVILEAPLMYFYQGRIYLNGGCRVRVRRMRSETISGAGSTYFSGACFLVKAGTSGAVRLDVDDLLCGSVGISNWSAAAHVTVKLNTADVYYGPIGLRSCLIGDAGYSGPVGFGDIAVTATRVRLAGSGSTPAYLISLIDCSYAAKLTVEAATIPTLATQAHHYRVVRSTGKTTALVRSDYVNFTGAQATACVAEVGGATPNEATARVDCPEIVVPGADIITGNATVRYQALSTHLHTGTDGTGRVDHGDIGYPRTPVADAAHDLVPADTYVAYTALTATRAVTLKNACLAYPEQEWIVADESGSAAANPITLVAESGTLYGINSINVDYGAVRIRNNGTNWFVRVG